MVESVRAWAPGVPLVREVLHATFEEHAYPMHTHDSWTVLLVDDGAVDYRLDRRKHRTVPGTVTILPPHVAHDGRTAERGTPFSKRALYLDGGWLPGAVADTAVLHPVLGDRRSASLAAGIHAAMRSPGDETAAEHGVLVLGDLVGGELGSTSPEQRRDAPLARRLRDLLDDRLPETVTVAEAGLLLHAHPGHLTRVFVQTYGIAPHQYVTGRRVDHARRLLVRGETAANAAAAAGFHDQSHMHRHFRRVLGTTPGAFAHR